MQLFRHYLPAVLIALFCALIVAPGIDPTGQTVAHAQRRGKAVQKPAKKQAATAKKKPAKKSGTASKKTAQKTTPTNKGSKENVARKGTRSGRTPSRPREREITVIRPTHQIVPDSIYTVDIAAGVTHHRIMTVSRQVANVVTVDLKSGARLRSYKARLRSDGLQNATDIAQLASEMIRDTVVAATNASFWRAGSNTPIGATIADGEVIEMPGYKQWSSLMIYEDGTAAIDRISLQGQLFWRFRRLGIDGVNRRSKGEEGIVVYNHYYGDSLPRGTRKTDSAILAEAFANKVSADIGDDTEGDVIDTAGIIRSYRESIVQEDREFPFLKIACKPMPPRRKQDPQLPPRIDDTMRMVVVEIDTGVVALPENGCIISLGAAAEWFSVVQPGDTISLLYSITPAQTKRVRDVLTATPRLVRDGRADPEHETEGSKARRFVDGKLSRSAVGISRGGDTLFLVTINSPNPSAETVGMSLAQLASFMKELGSWQAMNFDGGGSASMTINGEMISRQGERPTSRRVSNAVLVVRPFQERRPVAKRKPVMPVPQQSDNFEETDQ